MIISQRLPSRLQVIPEFLTTIIEKIKQLSIEKEQIFDIRLSLEEALINAIKHGNKSNADLSVEVNIETKDDHLIIKVMDQGEGFEFRNIPDPTTKENVRKSFGRGIFLIKNLMDEVDFFDCGRGIKMIKFFKKEADSEDNRRKT